MDQFNLRCIHGYIVQQPDGDLPSVRRLDYASAPGTAIAGPTVMPCIPRWRHSRSAK